MPLKTNHRRKHHTAHKKEKRTKHFMKVYAPYIPLLLIVGCGLFISNQVELKKVHGQVKSYAVGTTDGGLFDETNKERAKENIPELKYNNLLDAAAQAKADDMAAKNYWSHVTPDGKQPWIFIEAQQYPYQKAAENLAYGFETSKTTVSGWMNSPGHRANIMDPELQEVGFGTANVPDYQGKGPQTIVVAMYGRPAVVAQAAPVQMPVVTNASNSPQNVSYIQSVTSGKAPWSGFILGLLIGSIIMYLTVTHARGLRRALRSSENFIIHHPLLDVTLVALAALAVIASQSIGTIY